MNNSNLDDELEQIIKDQAIKIERLNAHAGQLIKALDRVYQICMFGNMHERHALTMNPHWIKEALIQQPTTAIYKAEQDVIELVGKMFRYIPERTIDRRRLNDAYKNLQQVIEAPRYEHMSS